MKNEESNKEDVVVMSLEDFQTILQESNSNYAIYLFSDERFQSKLEITNGDIEKAEQLMANPTEEDLEDFYGIMAELEQEAYNEQYESEEEEDQEAMINYMMNLIKNGGDGKHNLN